MAETWYTEDEQIQSNKSTNQRGHLSSNASFWRWRTHGFSALPLVFVESPISELEQRLKWSWIYNRSSIWDFLLERFPYVISVLWNFSVVCRTEEYSLYREKMTGSGFWTRGGSDWVWELFVGGKRDFNFEESLKGRAQLFWLLNTPANPKMLMLMTWRKLRSRLGQFINTVVRRKPIKWIIQH